MAATQKGCGGGKGRLLLLTGLWRLRVRLTAWPSLHEAWVQSWYQGGGKEVTLGCRQVSTKNTKKREIAFGEQQRQK